MYTIIYVAINIVAWAYVLGTITLLVTKQVRVQVRLVPEEQCRSAVQMVMPKAQPVNSGPCYLCGGTLLLVRLRHDNTAGHTVSHPSGVAC